jgi:hypothetical protein
MGRLLSPASPGARASTVDKGLEKLRVIGDKPPRGAAVGKECCNEDFL